MSQLDGRGVASGLPQGTTEIKPVMTVDSDGAGLLDVKEWACGINRSAFMEWQTNDSNWDSGFKVFVGRVMMNPAVLMMSINPGGGPSNFEKDRQRFVRGDFRPSDRVPYSGEGPFSKAVRDQFRNQTQLYKTKTTAIYTLFVRSKNTNFESLPPEQTRLWRPFSHRTVREIVKTLKPKRFLVFGFTSTARELRKILGEENFTTRSERKTTLHRENAPNVRLVQEYDYNSDSGSLPMFVRIHPTPYRGAPSTVEKEWMRTRFDEWLSD